jgi:predicted porin
VSAWAVDLTAQWCGLKAFGEYMHADGELNPTYYVTGGPTDTRADWMLGVQYKIGAFTPRVVYSYGAYKNPGGHQGLFLAGGTIEVTKSLTFYVEYVKWDVKADGGSNVSYEDGRQFVLAWHF